MALTIAIDGPVGSGKSTIARKLADTLGILHLDTGAMYRALALKVLREGIDPADAASVAALFDRTDIAVSLHEDRTQRTLLDGEDVTSCLRRPEVGNSASAVSKVPAVRRRMVALQQAFAEQSDIVMDGRDIGTRVLPMARYKFFLTATPETRAQRRFAEESAKGHAASYEQVLSDLLARDRQDSERAVDPLRPAADAKMIDTTDLDLDGVLTLLMSIIQEDHA